MHTMSQCGETFHNAGFTILPVEPNQKRVILPNWVNLQRDKNNVDTWVKNMPNHGVGALCRDMPFIDVDVTDVKMSKQLYEFLTELLGPDFPTRTGKAPKLAIPCKNPEGFEPFKKQKTSVYVEVASNVQQALEVLADGQMCVLAGIHPDTQQPYSWDELPTPNNLPTLTQRIIERLFEKFEQLAEQMVSKGLWVKKSGYSTLSTNSSYAVSGGLQQNSNFSAGYNEPQVKHIPQPRKEPTVNYTETEMKSCLDEIPELPHDDWLKIGMALNFQYKAEDVGKRLWKYYSQKYGAAYNEDEINRRYPTFNKDRSSSGITIRSILNYKNRAIAAKEPIPTFILSDQSVTNINNAKAAGRPPEWYDGWYYISQKNAFFKPVSGESLKPEAFNYTYLNSMYLSKEKSTAATHVLKLQLIPNVYTPMYRPDVYSTTSLVGSYNNKKFVNSYNVYIPSGEKPAPANMQTPWPVIDFLTRLIPDSFERLTVTDFLAYIVQKPGERVNWAPVLLGIPGTGKTTILEILKCCIGGVNARSVSAQQFTNKFNTFAEGAQFNFIEEVRISGSNRYQAMDAVKELITNDHISVTPKGVDTYQAKNVTSYILATNHPDALPLETTDRRYAVIQTDLNTPAQQFIEVYDWIDNRPHEVLNWLQNYKISSSFNPKGHAPKTKSTMVMANNTEDLIVSQIQDAIDDNTPLINKCLISFSALKDKLLDLTNMNDAKFTTHLRSKLLGMHYTKVGQVRLGSRRIVTYQPTINLQRRLQLPKDSYELALERAKAYKH